MAGGLGVPLNAAVDRSVVIIGGASVQNKLLASLIVQHAGCACTVRPIDGLDGPPVATNALALLDIGGMDAEQIGTHLQSISASASRRNIAVVNADDSLPFAQIVAWPGVRGVFFRDSTHDDLIKGIRAIFEGEYWLPRKVLWAHLERTRATPRPASTEAMTLTKKEVETLKLLAGGHSTELIARKLNVSPHTVKTHTYNLFRKIQVNNRVQAVHWALHNIDGIEEVLR